MRIYLNIPHKVIEIDQCNCTVLQCHPFTSMMAASYFFSELDWHLKMVVTAKGSSKGAISTVRRAMSFRACKTTHNRLAQQIFYFLFSSYFFLGSKCAITSDLKHVKDL
jgi:hypothetical protein